MPGAFQETHQREVIGEQPARSYPAAEPKPVLLLPRSHSPPTDIHREGALRFSMLSGRSKMDTVWEGPMAGVAIGRSCRWQVFLEEGALGIPHTVLHWKGTLKNWFVKDFYSHVKVS